MATKKKPTAVPVVAHYARPVNGRVAEVLSTSEDLTSLFHPNLAALWVGCSANVATGWLYDGHGFSAPAALELKPTVRLSPLQFMERLTDEERLAVSAAALASPAVLLWMLQLSGAQYVDLSDARTVAGVQALAAAGLLSADRAAAVLSLS